MPELPEVETIRRFLAKKLIGQEINRVEVRSPKQFLGCPEELIGQKVVGLSRRAKILIMETNQKAILIHLKMTGQIIYSSPHQNLVSLGHPLPFDPDALPNSVTRIIVTFTAGEKIFFNDLRKFGWWKVVAKDKVNQELPVLGPEPLVADFTLDYLVSRVAKTKRAIKVALLDQHLLSGIGNIYACESLYEARIDPRRPASELKLKEVTRLYQAIKKILTEAIALGGTSAADKGYVQPDTSLGGYQDHLRVYQREGEECPGCSGRIKRIKQAGRSTFFCPTCQR
jgi:formamidopyrimidine-DNA glycosylase